MIGLLVAVSALALWTLLGLGILTALRADLRSLLLVLTAPALGLSALTIAVFLLSRAGLAVRDFALPLTAVAMVLAGAALALRRPRLPASALPVAITSIVAIALTGEPMLTFGLNWIANANDDMTNYVLAGAGLFKDGFSAPLDIPGLIDGTDYPTAASVLQRIGSRPGAQLDLAWLHGVTGRDEQEIFMPLIVAMHGCSVFGAAALAMQATSRAWAATVAAALLALSPLASYAVFQQLISQVFGLAIALALLAVLMRQELYHGQAAKRSDFVLVAVLVTSLAIAYIEIASILTVAFLFYLSVLGLRHRFSGRALLRMSVAAGAGLLIFVNTYALDELHYLQSQIRSGVATSSEAAFQPVMLVPAALAALVGLRPLSISVGGTGLTVAIVVGGLLLLALLAAAAIQAWQLGAAACVAMVGAVLAVTLAVNRSSFGLFKLAMYMQPFLAVTAAVALTRARWWWLRASIGLCLAAVIVGSWSTQRTYASQSRNPVDLHDASSKKLLPAFRAAIDKARGPIVAVSDNPVVIKLEAADGAGHRVQFLSRDVFGPMLETKRWRSEEDRRQFEHARRLYAWPIHSFDLNAAGRERANQFADNVRAAKALASRDCTLALVTGSQAVVNRRVLPEGMPDLVFRGCRQSVPLLVFTQSVLGQSFYLFSNRRNVSFYQLEGDYFFAGRTMSGAGRYALFRVLGPSSRVRVAVELTSTFLEHESNTLAKASIIDVRRRALPIVGRGSARVFSASLEPRMIAGHPYVMLDMGRAGRQRPVPRHGIQALWGGSVALDPRYLTAYVRDVSVMTDADYRRLRPPRELRSFPTDLANRDLEYSGIYEDGWVSERAYVMLGAGPAADLVVSGDVPPGAGGRLRVLLDGRSIAARTLSPGTFTVRVPAAASRDRRRIDLRFSSAPLLPAPDRRPAAALLHYVGFQPPQ